MAVCTVTFCRAIRTPKDTIGIVEAIRVLSLARNLAVRNRTAELNQLWSLITTALQTLNEQLPLMRKTLTHATQLRLTAITGGVALVAVKATVRILARRIQTLAEKIYNLDTQLTPLVAQTAPKLLAN